jgi:hypothetical protein
LRKYENPKAKKTDEKLLAFEGTKHLSNVIGFIEIIERFELTLDMFWGFFWKDIMIL